MQEELDLDIVPVEITVEPLPPKGIRLKSLWDYPVEFENAKQKEWCLRHIVIEDDRETPKAPMVISLKQLMGG